MHDDSRLIIISLIVARTKRSLRALFDSIQQLFPLFCLYLLLYTVASREGLGDIVVKFTDGQPQRVLDKPVVVPYYVQWISE